MESARKALLDTLDLLRDHLDSLVLVGAQAIYLHTENFSTSVAPATDDADLAVISSKLQPVPAIEIVLEASGYTSSESGDPGTWITSEGVQVDLMTSRSQGNRISVNARGASINGHSKNAIRISDGLEACLIDFTKFEIGAFSDSDNRKYQIKVANPSAILIAKCFKIYERIENPARRNNKDSFDVYRILAGTPMLNLSSSLRDLRDREQVGTEVRIGLDYFEQLFARSLESPGVVAVGETVRGIDNENRYKVSALALAKELLKLLED
mgnify:CR=1 FL=1